MKDFDIFEQHFLEIVGEYQSVSASEDRLRDALRTESARAEAAESAREAAERSAAEAKNSATAAAASATHAATALAQAQEELAGLKIQSELVERQKSLLEERCVEMSQQVSSLERELQPLRPMPASLASLQRQYVELQEHVRQAVGEARNESSRLEAELRRVERCASGGSELRERARLAAAAHARERKLAAAELKHVTKELRDANVEIARLSAIATEHQLRNSSNEASRKQHDNKESETLAELRAALEAERSGSSRLENALAAAIADNATLAASIHDADNVSFATQPLQSPSVNPVSTNICAIDNFLAE